MKPLVLFDINGVLCDSEKRYSPNGNIYTFRQFKDGSLDFLLKLSSYADIGIFTSMESRNLTKILPGFPFQFKFIFSRDFCTLETKHKYKTYKDISRIRPYCMGYSKIIVVDDSPDKMKNNCRSEFVIYKNESWKLLHSRILIKIN